MPLLDADTAFFFRVAIKSRQLRQARLRRHDGFCGYRQVSDENSPADFSALKQSVFDFDTVHGSQPRRECEGPSLQVGE